MSEMQRVADAMFASAAGVLGNLTEQSASAQAASRCERRTEVLSAGECVVVATLPASDAHVVVRLQKEEMDRIVAAMLGSDDTGEMEETRASIASETASQIAIAMVDALAAGLGAPTAGLTAGVCTDAALLPPPPYESYDATIAMGTGFSVRLGLDLVLPVPKEEPVAAPAPEPARAPAPEKAQSVAFTPMRPTLVDVAPPGQANLELVHDVSLQVSAVLGKTVMPLREVVSLQSGSVFELDKLAADPIDLYVNNILIARGEVVVVDDKYAVKISELNPQA